MTRSCRFGLGVAHASLDLRTMRRSCAPRRSHRPKLEPRAASTASARRASDRSSVAFRFAEPRPLIGSLASPTLRLIRLPRRTCSPPPPVYPPSTERRPSRFRPLSCSAPGCHCLLCLMPASSVSGGSSGSSRERRSSSASEFPLLPPPPQCLPHHPSPSLRPRSSPPSYRAWPCGPGRPVDPDRAKRFSVCCGG